MFRMGEGNADSFEKVGTAACEAVPLGAHIVPIAQPKHAQHGLLTGRRQVATLLRGPPARGELRGGSVICEVPIRTMGDAAWAAGLIYVAMGRRPIPPLSLPIEQIDCRFQEQTLPRSSRLRPLALQTSSDRTNHEKQLAY